VVHHKDVYVEYDAETTDDVCTRRWNVLEDKPIETASELCYILRRITNANENRLEALQSILAKHPKAIVFYNFDYELDMLRQYLSDLKYPYSEWNGHRHEAILETDRWVYLVQYSAGAEGWNCITTDTIVYYSQNYSYKLMEQASGRINRMNTPFHDLYYYHITSSSKIDKAISRALKNKKQFNERSFTEKNM